MSKKAPSASPKRSAQEVAPQVSDTATNGVKVDPKPAASAAEAFVVEGFRSAKFGMDEAEVRASILTDFGIEGDAIQAGENTVERTQILTVSVPNLIRHGGTAQVSYVFGYLTKKLIQVGATWSAQTDPDTSVTMLYENGELLRNHFMSEAYASDSLKTNVVISNGIMMFRGADSENHVTLLLLQGSFATADNGSSTLTPTSLDLLYSSSPDQPDIFKLPKGSF